MPLRYLYILIFLGLAVSLTAQSNQTCASATPLTLGAVCQADSLPLNLQNAEPVSCPEELDGALWYSYTAGFTGILRLETGAKFNDAVAVFTGSCGALTETTCSNRDEYGFAGEDFYFPVTSGTNYHLQVSGVLRNFGISNDSLCIKISQATALPALPINDLCADALPLNIGENCVYRTNINATLTQPLTENAQRARADIWWQFTANETETILKTEADFSAVTAVYAGNCTTLTELQFSRGADLFLTDLTIDESYFVQVSGNFATIEGNVCLEFFTPEIITNKDCSSAIPLTLDAACTPFSNVNATLGDILPSCDFAPAADVWFSFVAPTSGKVQFRSNADFLHSVAVYAGICEDATEVECVRNPQSCDGFIRLESLSAGETYYLQILSHGATFGHLEGTGCLEIFDGTSETGFVPLSVSVSPACLNIVESQLNITAEGGIGTYTFTGNEDGEILSGGGAYLVKVTDEAGCSAIAAGEVDCIVPAPCGMFYYLNKTAASCAYATDGTASVSVSGADAPTFEWSTGATTTDVTGLEPGYHAVTISDGEDCSFQIAVIISAPDPIEVNLGVINSDTETSNDGSIGLTVSGGNAPYTYLWDNGATSASIDNLATGDYAYTITDADGCTHFDIVTIIVDPACPENRTLSLAETESTTITYAASDFITSSSNIATLANITYLAGSRITLQTGFKVEEGAYFLGRLEICEEESVQTEEVTIEEEFDIVFYPNPTQGIVFMKMQTERPQTGTINIYDQMGRPLTQQEFSTKSGSNSTPISVKGFATGAYFAKVILEERVFNHCIVVED